MKKMREKNKKDKNNLRNTKKKTRNLEQKN